MKKIFDWTVGSFFRTIGRTIAFFAMATLVYYLLSYNDIDFGIKDLFFERVKADTQQASVWITYYSDQTKTTELENSGQFQYIQPNANGNTFTGQNIYITTQTKNENFDYILMPFQITGREYSTATYTNKVSHCSYSQVQSGSSTYYQPISCDWTSSGNVDTDIEVFDIDIKFNITIASTTNSAQSPCTINEEGYLKCMLLPNVDYDKLILSYSMTAQNNTSPIRFNFGHVVGRYTSAIDRQTQASQQTNEAIANQTQQQQQQHQETMNSSTTDAENDATSFFGNFTVEDQGGLSAIVTAPLNTIRSLLSSTCADLVLPLPFVEEDLTLPCMYSIYTRHFGSFFSLYQTIILGIIAYRCIMSIFFDIKGFTNPNDDRIEVMDL